MKIGVLALQGAFIEHVNMIQKLGVDCVEIRQPRDFDSLDGIILPGGESTVMMKLLHDLDLYHPIKNAIASGLPAFGTCAGLILMAESLLGSTMQTLSAMNLVAKRNAYGRQLGSFETRANFNGVGDVDMVFIRAPIIASIGQGVEALSVVNGDIVAAKQGKMLVTSFHPELTQDTRIHKYFLSMC